MTDGRITVKGAAQSVLYFSDRPNRLVGSMATRDLVTRWDAGADGPHGSSGRAGSSG